MVKDNKKNNEFVTSQKAAAEYIGVSIRTVRRWTSEGLARTEAGYSKKDLVKWKLAKGRPPTETRDRKETAEADLKEANAKLKELELRIRRGEYILAEDVKRGRVRRVLAVKRRLMALEKKLPPLLPLKNRTTAVKQARQIIHREVQECIDAFSGQA